MRRNLKYEATAEAAVSGLDTDIDQDTLKKMVKKLNRWVAHNCEEKNPIEDDYDVYVLGANHKVLAMKAAHKMNPKLQRLVYQNCQLFYGITKAQQIHVSFVWYECSATQSYSICTVCLFAS